MLICLLQSANTASCPGTSGEAANFGTTITEDLSANVVAMREDNKSSQLAGGRRVFVDASNRIQFSAPSSQVMVLEAAKVPVSLHVPGAVLRMVVQYPVKSGGKLGEEVDVNTTTSIMTDADGTTYVPVVPVRVGRIRLAFFGTYPDGGMFNQEVELQVLPSARKIVQLEIGSAASPIVDIPYMYATADPAGPVFAQLNVNITYAGTDKAIQLEPRYANFAVRSAGNVPVISLDTVTGVIKPLMPGHALIQTTVGTKTHFTCVIVTAHDGDTPARGDTDCRDLLTPGEEFP